MWKEINWTENAFKHIVVMFTQDIHKPVLFIFQRVYIIVFQMVFQIQTLNNEFYLFGDTENTSELTVNGQKN